MSEHLSPERISLLLDEPGSVEGGEAHLAACQACASEYERMSRMRMALSALPDLDAPADGWRRLERALGGEEGEAGRAAASGSRGRPPGDARVHRTAPRARVLAFPGGVRPLWAAAVVGLFAAGLVVGRSLGPGGTGAGTGADDGPLAAAEEPVATTQALADAGGAEGYLRTVAELEALRDETLGPGAEGDPARMAERLMELDALVEASREALRQAPADPVLNNFLFDVVDRRDRMAGELDRTLRFTAAEY
ncbi:MAG: hypothetical protein RRA92_03125 [Gemmatimonadota bacterium]|nr:hypothetical protein [Gemmatimonadota bacterium]